ncbi:MAG: hypothetical protein PHI66_01995 [Candidatus Pacebacteria bacterium]|nr:hypothetical protein [Candidatus Paceibacterota bacterium]
MYIILLALINTLSGAIITIKWKRLRTNGLHPVSALGLFCFGIPLWLTSLIALSYKFDIVYSSEYFLYIILWSAIVIVTNLGSIFLMKFQALSEMTIYKLGFSTALAVAVDSIFFKTDFSLYMLTGIFFLFISGILLSKNKKTNDMNILLILSIILILSILGISLYSIYKYTLPIQPNPVIHGIISQLVVYISFSFFAYKHLRKDYSSHLYNRKDITDFGLLIFIFTITEAFLFKELPLTIIILLSVISLLIYAVYDIKKKELVLSQQIYLAGALSTAALVMINIGN